MQMAASKSPPFTSSHRRETLRRLCGCAEARVAQSIKVVIRSRRNRGVCGASGRQLLPWRELPVHDQNDVIAFALGERARGATDFLLAELSLLGAVIGMGDEDMPRRGVERPAEGECDRSGGRLAMSEQW